MTYPRPPYRSPEIPLRKAKPKLQDNFYDIPVLDTPITPLENFIMSARHQTPVWVPNWLTDFQTLFIDAISFNKKTGVIERGLTKDHPTKDWFGVDWTWVAEAHGPMLTPGTQFMDDITKWEACVKFPDLSAYDFDTCAEDFMKNEYDPTKVLNINIGQSCTERLIALLGGYSEGLMSLLIEPEAVTDFLNRFSDYFIELVDKVCDRYPVKMITFHDDWGTERDTFFSEQVMEDLVFEPTKRIIDHIKSRSCLFELHSCGNIMRFVPYMIDMDIDFIQIQRRAVDVPLLKEKYGDKISLDLHVEGLVYYDPDPPIEEYLANIRKTVDLYGHKGGFFTNTTGSTSEYLWRSIYELYCYSREYYDRERGE